MERPSFERVDDLGHVELSAEQRPLLGWAVAMHLSVFVIVPAAMLAGLSIITVPFFFLAILGFMVGLSWRRRARFQLTPTSLRVDAWAGRLGRPVRVTLPLESLEVSFESTSRVNERPVYRLSLASAGIDPVDIRGLACTGEELEQFQRAVAASAVHARARHGEGEAEIPAALRRMQQAEPPPGR